VLPKKAILGAIWSIGTGFGSRAVTLASTLLLTRFLAPAVYGEVSLAAVVVMTANMVSQCGLGQYIVAKRAGREILFQATVISMSLGFAALALVVLLRDPLCASFGAPGAAAYLPWLGVAMAMDRIAFIPERVLLRDMRFRAASISRSLGEVVFGVGTVAFAALGHGGNAVVIATLLRSALKLLVALAVVDRREWLTPCRLDRATTKEFFRFGGPITVASVSELGSRRWDNLLMAALFGPAVAGMYNYAYNLADIPASQIGESIGDVLAPSLAEMEHHQRREALLRALTLVILVVCPLAVGLGTVAPTLVKTFFDARWEPIWPMLAILSMLSVVRPVAWMVAPYLQVESRPRTMMLLELSKAAFLLIALVGLGLLGGPLWACAAPGVAFTYNALSNLWVLKRIDASSRSGARAGLSIGGMLRPLLPPLLACGPMVGAVLGVRYGLGHASSIPKLGALALEMLAGALVFVPSAWILAPAASKELVRQVAGALAARREKPDHITA
jgi:lipopolysaccharide exporter